MGLLSSGRHHWRPCRYTGSTEEHMREYPITEDKTRRETFDMNMIATKAEAEGNSADAV